MIEIKAEPKFNTGDIVRAHVGGCEYLGTIEEIVVRSRLNQKLSIFSYFVRMESGALHEFEERYLSPAKCLVVSLSTNEFDDCVKKATVKINELFGWQGDNKDIETFSKMLKDFIFNT